VSSLKERISRLESDLRSNPMRHYIYKDLPFALFCYPPDQEWAMRREMRLLKTRIEQDTKRQIILVSLADLLWQAVERSEGLDAIIQKESKEGFEAAQTQVYDYLTDADWQPLPKLLEERLEGLDPDRNLVFLWRAGAFAPNIYRISTLLDQMKGRTNVPCVLFMPATNDDSDGLRFLGLTAQERRGSYHTKIYVD